MILSQHPTVSLPWPYINTTSALKQIVLGSRGGRGGRGRVDVVDVVDVVEMIKVVEVVEVVVCFVRGVVVSYL